MKKIGLFIILSLSIFILFSCHGKIGVPEPTKEEYEVPEEFDESRNYNITFWAKNDTNIVQKTIYENAISEFEKLYPNINVDIVQYTDYGRIYEDVIKNISTKTTPNVCIAYPDHVATYKEGENVVVPLDNLINNTSYGLGGNDLKYTSVNKTDIIEKFLNECIIDKSYYMLPFIRSTEALYVNKTYLEENGFEIPEIFTWEYVWEICKYAEEKSLAEGTKMIPLIYKSTDNMFIQLCKQYGYDFTTDDGDVLFLSDEVKNMLLELGGYANKGYFDTFKRVSYPGNHFNKGQCIFAVDSTAGATWMGQDAPLVDIDEAEIANFETVVKMIPQVDPNNPKMISQGPSLCVFDKADKQEVVASWIFAQYLLTNDIQRGYTQTEGYLPVTHSAIESAEFKAYMQNENEYYVKRDATQLIIDNIDNTFITSVYNGSSSARNAAGYLIEAIFLKKHQTSLGIDDLFNNVKARYFSESSVSNSDRTIQITLICSICVVWVGIIVYTTNEHFKKRKKLKKM